MTNIFNPLFSTLLIAGAPVARDMGQIAPSLIAGGATILVAATGSGKSLVTPAAWAQANMMRGDTSRHRQALTRFGRPDMVVVCVPRRFLAINNAETVAELAGCTLGREVGYATGEGHLYSQGETALLFATYGSFLASGLANDAMHVVFDEVHEGALDSSIARALVHRRIRLGEPVDVLEMSATLNAERQAGYWGRVAHRVQSFEAEGTLHPCDFRHKKLNVEELREIGLLSLPIPRDLNVVGLAYEAARLIAKEGRQGGLIFRPGIQDCEETAAWIRVAGKALGIDIVGAAIHGKLDHKQRTDVVNGLAEGRINVVVGTNVIESGVNLRGQDFGLSCGKGKEMTQHPNGSLWLDEIDLPQWRLTQQAGRSRRFGPGIFTLFSDKPMTGRAKETTPEITRLPLTHLVATCAEYGVRAHELEFDVPVKGDEIIKAERKLQTLEIIGDDYRLTPEGEFGKKVPVDSEMDSALWEARKLGILADFIPVVALIEEQGIKANFKEAFGLEFNEEERTSDWVCELKLFNEADTRLRLFKDKAWDELKARMTEADWMEFQGIRNGTDPQGRRDAKRFLLELLNVSMKKFWAVKETCKNLRRSLSKDLNDERYRAATTTEIRRSLLAGQIGTLVRKGRYNDEIRTFEGGAYPLGKSSVVTFYGDYEFAIGKLLTITAKSGKVFTFFAEVTAVTFEDLQVVCPYLLEKSEDTVETYRGQERVTNWRLFGALVKETRELVETDLA